VYINDHHHQSPLCTNNNLAPNETEGLYESTEKRNLSAEAVVLMAVHASHSKWRSVEAEHRMAHFSGSVWGRHALDAHLPKAEPAALPIRTTNEKERAIDQVKLKKKRVLEFCWAERGKAVDGKGRGGLRTPGGSGDSRRGF
jgi:hypothetical protein